MDRSALPAGHAPAYFYEIDADDRIVAASDSWDAFALENDGDHLVIDKVRGDSIWDHISDPETIALYRRMFSLARQGKPVQFFLRCDSPSTRRMLSVHVELAENDVDLRISTLLFRADQREPIELRSDSGVKVPTCSWCEKVLLPESGWQEVESAAAWLKGNGLTGKCSVSYTICPACRKQLELQLNLAGGTQK